jgi:hypothetical protein
MKALCVFVFLLPFLSHHGMSAHQISMSASRKNSNSDYLTKNLANINILVTKKSKKKTAIRYRDM